MAWGSETSAGKDATTSSDTKCMSDFPILGVGDERKLRACQDVFCCRFLQAGKMTRPWQLWGQHTIICMGTMCGTGAAPLPLRKP